MEQDELKRLQKANRKLQMEKKRILDFWKKQFVVCVILILALLVVSIVQSCRVVTVTKELRQLQSQEEGRTESQEKSMEETAELSEREATGGEAAGREVAGEETAGGEAVGEDAAGAEAAGGDAAGENTAGGEPMEPDTSVSAAETPVQPTVNSSEGIGKKVYLTFDDGPSKYTYELLDILRRYDVKATFFVTHHGGEEYAEKYRQILAEGHSLGIHSVSHDYASIYANLDAFAQDVRGIQEYVRSVTGFTPTLYRFPGGSSNQMFKYDLTVNQCIDWLNANGFVYYDWNVSSGDAASPPLPSGRIAYNVLDGPNSVMNKGDTLVVLMHDADDKARTMEELPYIIEQLKARGYEILPITESTTPIHHR